MSEQKDKTKSYEWVNNHICRNKMIFESSIDGFCMIDLEGKLIEVNTSLCNITGYSKEELLKMKIADLNFGETAEQTTQCIERIMKHGCDRFETKHCRKDGEKVDLEVNTYFFDFDKDRVLFSFFRDITQHKKNEDELRMLIHAVNHCGDGMAMINLKGIIQYVNKAFAEMHGYTPVEVLGKHVAIFHLHEQMVAVSAANQQIISIGYFSGEIWHSRRDGTTFLGQMNNVLLRDNSGNSVGMIGTLKDVTMVREAEKALYESEEKLKAILGSSTDCILVWDRNYDYLYVNDNARKHVGVSRDKELKNIVDGLGHIPDFMHLWMERIDKVFETGESMRVEDSILVGKRHVYSESILSPIEDKYGNLFAVGVVYRDVSEQKQVKMERDNYKENLLKAQKHAYIGSMGAIVAHQVNQPLTKINILLDRAIEQLEGVSGSASALKNIKEGLIEANKANSIIRKFRQYSKNSTLEGMTNVNISSVADKIVSVLSEKAKQTEMHISIKGLSNLPGVEANETALEQIFLVIIQNAIEASDGQKSYELGITGKFANGNIELQFTDDCCGIAPENLDKIFEPFFSTKTKDMGMGLGLDIVQQILISLEGQILVESQLGKGTTFYVTLPISNTMEY